MVTKQPNPLASREISLESNGTYEDEPNQHFRINTAHTAQNMSKEFEPSQTKIKNAINDNYDDVVIKFTPNQSIEDPIRKARNSKNYHTSERSGDFSPLRQPKLSSISINQHTQAQQYQNVKIPYPMKEPLLRRRIISQAASNIV